MSQNDSDAEIDSLESEYEHPPRPIPSDNDTTYRQGTPFARVQRTISPNGSVKTQRKNGAGDQGRETTTLGNSSIADLTDRLNE